MGYTVDRPVKEGVGEKPTTPKPSATPEYFQRAFNGQKDAAVKPQVKPGTDGAA